MDSLKFDTLIAESGLFEPAAYPGNAFFEIWRNESEVSFYTDDVETAL